MSGLPFLVEHGAWLWTVVGVGLAGAGVLAIHRRATRVERRAARREAAERSATASAPYEGVATIRGTLHGGSAATLSVVATGAPTAYHDAHDAELFLDHAGDRIELAGTLRVLRGTVADAAWQRVPESARAELRDQPAAGGCRVATVRDGDEVVVTGQLERAPGTEETGYRAEATRWTMRDAELIAAAPAARAVPYGIVYTLLTAAMLFGFASAAAYGAGKLAMSRARIEHGEDGFVPGGPRELEAVSLAAALPGSRADALGELDRRFEHHYQQTAESFAAWRRVAQLRGGCGGELRVLVDREAIHDVAEVARDCGDAAEVVRAQLLLGNYAEAAARVAPLDPPREAMYALIGSAAWSEAAIAAESMRARLARIPDAKTAAAIDPRLACAVLWFRSKTGDRAALAALHATNRSDPFCRVMDALTMAPEAGRARALAEAFAVAPDPTAERAILSLEWAAGWPLAKVDARGRPVLDVSDGIYLDAIGGGAVRDAALAPHAQRARAQDVEPVGTAEHALLHFWLAEHALVLGGDYAGALAEARLAASGDERKDVTSVGMRQEDAQALQITIALRGGGELPPVSEDAFRHPMLVGSGQLRRGERSSWVEFPMRHGELRELRDRALAAAAEGDGGPLAELAARGGLRIDMHIATLFALWPRLTRGREELAERIRMIDPDLMAMDRPFDRVRTGSVRRDLAHLIGDTAAAAEWQAVIARHAAVFADRERLEALIVWTLL